LLDLAEAHRICGDRVAGEHLASFVPQMTRITQNLPADRREPTATSLIVTQKQQSSSESNFGASSLSAFKRFSSKRSWIRQEESSATTSEGRLFAELNIGLEMVSILVELMDRERLAALLRSEPSLPSHWIPKRCSPKDL
jgi:hypothetical protein